ncbi:uncharacterized protein B0H18DRAFT_240325 [Fomitopsis serialis]|uniref:uncharacterized protein n=1 Tax=Fomitopsis serialis TaxID=139415 RepID=UPI002008BE7C|nr:uncharacterized protein B0H18DRAFT_240325 [Neoantrodia serialis]KAH9912649.1 hypothetical protein B0H18DRAFT_240325 [Neoantrodia serialis]
MSELISGLPSPAHDDGQIVPLDALELFARERCWPDNMRCFCDLTGGQSRPPHIFTPSYRSAHAGSPCLGCRSFGRPGGHCSYFVNLRELVHSADIWSENLVLATYPKRVHRGIWQGVPMTPTSTNGRDVGLAGIGLPSSGSLSPLTPLSSAASTPSKARSAQVNEDDKIDWDELPSLLSQGVQREDFAPSDDEVTTTLLNLLDPSSEGVSFASLARVLARCRRCNRCVGRNVLFMHSCAGRIEPPDDSLAYYALPSSSDNEDDAASSHPSRSATGLTLFNRGSCPRYPL